jgi:hypothetical protein
MPLGESPTMPSIYVAIALGVLSAIFYLLAFLSLGTCGDGTSLIYVGLGFLLIATSFASYGGSKLSLGVFFLFLAFILVGLYLTYGAGCAI